MIDVDDDEYDESLETTSKKELRQILTLEDLYSALFRNLQQ